MSDYVTPKPDDDVTERTAVSFPSKLKAAGMKRAKTLRRSFSGHLQHLVEEDLKKAASSESSTAEVGA